MNQQPVRSKQLLAAALGLAVIVALVAFFASGGKDALPDELANANGSQAVEGNVTPAAGGAETLTTREQVSTETPATKQLAELGKVRIFVGRQSRLPVADVTVRLNATHTAKTGRDGWAEFTVPPSTYLASIDPESLPKAVVPAALQTQQPPHYEVPDGYFGRVAKVAAGETVKLSLRVFGASRIVGLVTDHTGNPLANMHVRAQCRQAGLSGYAVDATTRADGVYMLEGILPGIFTIEVHTKTGEGVVPVRFEVLEGVSYSLEPLVVGGIGKIRGRVVDQDDQPLKDLPVVAWACEPEEHPGERGFGLSNVVGAATTKADGTFEMKELPAGLLKVQVHPEGTLTGDDEGTRLARVVQPATADLRKATSVDVGQFSAEVSRPFRLGLTVMLDEARIRAIDPTKPSSISVRVYLVPQTEFADPSKWRRLDEEKGRYSFRCETPHVPVNVIVRVMGIPDKVVTILPKPLDVVEMNIDYPQ